MESFTRRGFLRAGIATSVGAGAGSSLAGCLAPTATGTTGDDWSHYRFAAARTGYNSEVAGPAADVDELWSFRTEDRSVSSPAVAGDMVFVNSDSIAALDAREGASRWSMGVFHQSGSGLAIVDDTVFAASRFALFALDAEDGTERWNATYGNRVLSTPAVVDGTVYVVSTDRRLPLEATVRALSAEDGSERWRTTVGEMTMPPFVPAVADGTVYVGKEKLFALDAEDGTIRWTAEPGGTFGTPAVTDGTVYVGSRQEGNRGAVFAFDADDGTRKWRVDTGKSARSLAVADDEVYVASDAVYALEATNGTERWRFDSNRYLLAAPAVTSERVYLAGLLGTVRALDRGDGAEAWLVETPGVVLSAPAVVEDGVFVGGSDEVVYAFG